MGSGYVHTCDSCGYSVSTSGPWEFYRDSAGRRKPYGHPVPTSEEAKERGIYGLSALVYCFDCDETFDVILIEYKNGSYDALSVWGGLREYRGEGTVRCPKCDGRNLVLGPNQDREIACPRCREGKLIGVTGWMS